LLRATIPAEVFVGGNVGAAGIAIGHLGLFHDMEAQECFADDDFVAVTQHLPLSWG
jgi:hypothetical protein